VDLTKLEGSVRVDEMRIGSTKACIIVGEVSALIDWATHAHKSCIAGSPSETSCAHDGVRPSTVILLAKELAAAKEAGWYDHGVVVRGRPVPAVGDLSVVGRTGTGFALNHSMASLFDDLEYSGLLPMRLGRNCLGAVWWCCSLNLCAGDARPSGIKSGRSWRSLGSRFEDWRDQVSSSDDSCFRSLFARLSASSLEPWKVRCLIFAEGCAFHHAVDGAARGLLRVQGRVGPLADWAVRCRTQSTARDWLLESGAVGGAVVATPVETRQGEALNPCASERS